MNILVFAPVLPYPPHGGGRADIWRRVLAFKQLGHKVMLASLVEIESPEIPSSSDFVHVDSVVTQRFSFPIRRGFFITIRQLINCRKVPWHAATRVPETAELQLLFHQVNTFKPDLIWLDGPWFGIVGHMIASRTGIPIVYRSHNIEFKYLQGQANASPKLRDRVAWSLACVGLKDFEEYTMRRCTAVFDISVDDLKYWENVGLGNLYWLPPLPELAFATGQADPIDGDIVFLGNLNTPSNIRGVEWLVTEVLPRVRVIFPDVRCRVVGSNPTAFVTRLLGNGTGVELCANVADTTPYLFGARVLVNPVMTGSGVQVKMLDMLMTDAPIVTTAQGTRGLPGDFRKLFRIADEAALFAQAVCEELRESTVDRSARALAREVFSVVAVGRALDTALQSI